MDFWGQGRALVARPRSRPENYAAMETLPMEGVVEEAVAEETEGCFGSGCGSFGCAGPRIILRDLEESTLGIWEFLVAQGRTSEDPRGGFAPPSESLFSSGLLAQDLFSHGQDTLTLFVKDIKVSEGSWPEVRY